MTEVILIAAAFFSSIVSGMIGMAGGMLLLVIMSAFFTPATLIPLHGAVQLASNGSRSFYLRKHLNWSIIGVFAVGTFLGAAAGSQMLIDIPEPQYRIALGVFILFLTWLPKFKIEKKVKGKFFWLGSATGFISLFAGATGPFLAPFFLRENLQKEALVGTKAACQILTHTAKMLVFAAIGFSFGPYWKLLAGMILAVFAGNYIGKTLLGKLKQEQFIWLFKAVISLLAIRLIWLGLTAVTSSLVSSQTALFVNEMDEHECQLMNIDQVESWYYLLSDNKWQDWTPAYPCQELEITDSVQEQLAGQNIYGSADYNQIVLLNKTTQQSQYLDPPGWSFVANPSFCNQYMAYWMTTRDSGNDPFLVEAAIFDMNENQVIRKAVLGRDEIATDFTGYFSHAIWDNSCEQARFKPEQEMLMHVDLLTNMPFIFDKISPKNK